VARIPGATSADDVPDFPSWFFPSDSLHLFHASGLASLTAVFHLLPKSNIPLQILVMPSNLSAENSLF
jgi:hypothetical protein